MYHKTVNVIKELLNTNNCWYQYFTHNEVKTSQEASKIRPGYTLNQGAKALILKYKINGTYNFVMFVLQGSDKLNSKVAKKLLNTSNLTFATEQEVFNLTDGVKIGGVPPFGNLFNIPVYTDSKLLTKNKKIIFNAGDRCVSIAMLSSDYIKLVNPIIANFSEEL